MLSLFPLWYQYLIIVVFGLIIGSFLNVYIYRFHTGKSLSGSSHCLSCGHKIKSYDLVPLFSYLFLRGKCRFCGCHIPVRYFVVELMTALLFVASFYKSGLSLETVYLCAVSSVMVIITVYDIRHYIIPDSLTISLIVLVSLWYSYLWYGGLFSTTLILYTFVAALCGAGFFFVLWFVSKGAWLGFGDVKLAFPLALIVGPGLVFSMIVYSFWIGAAISLCLIGFAKFVRGQVHLRKYFQTLTMKSVVPFAPFMIAGCLIVLFTNFNVLELFSSL